MAVHELCSEQAAKSGRQSAPRFFITFDRYSCQTILSFSSSFTTAPCNPAARSCAATSPVPVVLLGARNRALVAEGRLADIAPTLLELMELPKPKEMTGTSLLRAD